MLYEEAQVVQVGGSSLKHDRSLLKARPVKRVATSAWNISTAGAELNLKTLYVILHETLQYSKDKIS